jgi:CheY-like chemotaxis protein
MREVNLMISLSQRTPEEACPWLPAPSGDGPASKSFTASRLTILVIDDDPDFRNWAASVLRRRGHRVIATSSLNSIENAAHGPKLPAEFDVAFVDMIMPEMDGLETIRALRTLAPSTRIVAMSAGGERGRAQLYLHMAEQFGAVAALAKTFIGEDLCDVAVRAWSLDMTLRGHAALDDLAIASSTACFMAGSGHENTQRN